MFNSYDPAEPPEMYPASLYIYQRHITTDPLPPVHEGSIFHYTKHATAVEIFKSGRMFASRYDCMNDPGENTYGWDVIRKHYKTVRHAYSSRAQGEIDKVLAYNQHEDWLTNVYVLSASIAENNLNQFRFYGDVSIELPGGVWTQILSDMSWAAHDRRVSWRPVIYDKEKAVDYINSMLDYCARIIDEPAPDDCTDEGLIAMKSLRRLAMLIKHEEYTAEQEVRLVIESRYRFEVQSQEDVYLMKLQDGDLHYVETHPETDGYGGGVPPLIKSVRLGPKISDSVSRGHMTAHMNANLSRPIPPLYVSDLPFYERGQKSIAKP